MHMLSGLNLCFLAGTLGQGGAERQLFYILQALSHAGATPRLLSLDQGGFWEEPIRALGIPITRVGDQPSRLARLFRVMKEVRKNLPDVLQSQHFFTNAYVGASTWLLRVSGIGAMRANGRDEVRASGPLGGWLNLHCPPMIAANSQAAIQYAIAHGVSPSRLYFLPNVVDTSLFKPLERLPKVAVTLVAVGRMAKQKRLDRFISILHRLRNDFRLNIRGLIVGSGHQNDDLRCKLESQARSLGLLPDVAEFRSAVSDIRSVYHEAAACVLTSDFEGTPNVLLEAMACGLPVVASRVDGVSGIVQHGETGFLAEPDDLDGLTSAVAELVKNMELRREMGRRARRFVEENHSLERLPSLLARLYERVLPGAGYPLTPALSQDEYEVV